MRAPSLSTHGSGRVASTIVDATGDEPRVLRAGALTEAEVLLATR